MQGIRVFPLEKGLLISNVMQRKCIFTALKSAKHAQVVAKSARAFSVCAQCKQKQQPVQNIFDRKAKKMQRNRTALMEDYEVYQYIRDKVGYSLADRIRDIKRKFNVVVDLGCGRGHIGSSMDPDTVGTLIQCEMAEMVLAQACKNEDIKTFSVVADEEYLPFKENSLDLVVSGLSLHWVNDLPGTFKQIQRSLKPDGAFLGTVFGGETLYELRCSLQLAEIEREGGFGPHISPFVEPIDIGALLDRAGFNLVTMDTEEINIAYPSMFEVMEDLKGMGENNCAWNRKSHIQRDTLIAADAIYREMYGLEDGNLPATFQIIHFIGWKPHPSQKKPAKRGSATVSIKDIDKLDQIIKEHELQTKQDTEKKKSEKTEKSKDDKNNEPS
ncbi:arginine-hydroxylase NDUFAF5, mitochondrial [Lingula anatina]|uniref:Arginine-hydroxylase NDUFAF5, mitochondrial n=1 Tax=Lingula anatina TaxID=7574 RepID=A0A1S3HJ98_LINAN|nr:arginine-hydroxylase NDUFAF5, mitochondrial [Lingula anatina]|eukprot:XP_013386082.1 arginine-hydroxylase NDUFAF5, mitochondrial [Lingula anatina]